MAQAGYSGTPLVKKLGIKPGSTVALLAAPDGFARELIGLPGDVRLVSRLSRGPEMAIWFVRARRDIDRRMGAVAGAMGPALWIAWPKRASGMKTDLTEDLVRAAGLANGLVDYKVCAMNDTWSGLKFARRREEARRHKGSPATRWSPGSSDPGTRRTPGGRRSRS
jgi:hypothetical protein